MAKRKNPVTHPDALAAAADAAARRLHAARDACRLAEQAHDAARESLARSVCRDALAGGTCYLPWLRGYVLSGPLWDEVGREAYFRADPHGAGMDDPAAWRAVFAAVAKVKGWE